MAQKTSTVAPYFRDAQQQHEANILGMWVFLVTEVLLFGGLFVAYLVYSWAYSETFHEASRELDLMLSSLNTVILLTSSLTVALGVHAAQTERRSRLVLLLVLTLILGGAFLGIKGYEYYQKFLHHLVPGAHFVWPGAEPGPAGLFFALYFVTTGLHAFHMIIGMALLTYVAWRGWRGAFSAGNYDLVELSGLYWHFVDVAWVFIFPLYYLIDRSQ